MEITGLLMGLAYTGLGMICWVVVSWIRVGRRTDSTEGNRLIAVREIESLSLENETLKGKVGQMEDRLRVLERIATDPSIQTAREIEILR